MSEKVSRRTFTQAGLMAGAAFPWLLPQSAIGANDRIRVGVIGAGNRSNLLIDQLPEGAEIVAVADCYRKRSEEAAAKRKAKWRIYDDHRELLDQKDIDGVIVGTNDHGRVLCAIHAVAAGKDVYAEKPLSLYVAEGRALVRAVRKYNRILQVGSQQRSMAMNRLACDFVRSGGLGRIRLVLGVNYPQPVRIGGLPEEAGAGGDELGHVARPDREAAFQSGAVQPLDAVLGLFRRRDDQLGRARYRPDAGGIGDGHHRPGGILSSPGCSSGRGRMALRQWRGSPAGDAGRRESAGRRHVRRRERAHRNHAQRFPHGPAQSHQGTAAARKRSTNGSGRSGRPSITCRTGWIACAAARRRWPTWRSATARSAFATSPTSPASLAASFIGTRRASGSLGDAEANDRLTRPRRKGYELPEVG